MKYDFEIDYNQNNVWSIAASMIKPNSVVLEFGSATGYFTKYLADVLKCKVFIVEIDKESFDCAIIYAADGICENIEKYGWADKFKGIKFDSIIFLDVLEHLYNPSAVLSKCKEYMADDSSIVISLPNIAHNSVLINLFNNNFIYTEMGLLDNTHIRFFTYNQLISMLKDIGYYPASMNAIYKKVGTTEIPNSYELLPADCRQEFKMREHGDLYQFLFECKIVTKDENNQQNNLILSKNYSAKFYIREKTYFLDVMGNEDYIQMEFEDSESNDITIELCDVQNSIIQIDYIEINGVAVKEFVTNAFYNDEKTFYFDANAKILHRNDSIIKSVLIRLKYISLDHNIDIARKLGSNIKEYEKFNLQLQEDVITLQTNITQYEDWIVQKDNQLHTLEESITQKDNELQKMEESIAKKNTEIHDRERLITDKELTITNIKNENMLLNQQIYDIYNSRTFKLANQFRKVYRFIFRKK